MQMLGDNTSELVTKLVTKMQPGIDSSTAGLSEQATAFVMEVCITNYLKNTAATYCYIISIGLRSGRF
jgi:hypothetical protein